jgi:mRNA interferase HigB
MNIIAKGTMLYYIDRYPKAKQSLLTWYHEFSRSDFHNFNELKTVYGNASIIANNRVIFNIKGNDFRLIVSVNFRKLAAYIIWFGPHKEYYNIDTETISFDPHILNYKAKTL